MTQKRNTLFFLTFYCLFFQAFSQRDNVWLFGANAGLNFSVSPPQPFSGGKSNIPDNTSSISDVNGNLLFYTDGSTVWNKNHLPMPNGQGLLGNYTAGQCALIVPVPCSNTQYLIFHPTEFASPGYLRYTQVDMSLNSGLGDVTQKKNVLLGAGYTEKLCAIFNPSGGNYWVVTHEWNTDRFIAFMVTSNPSVVQAVSSPVGSVHNCGVYSGAHDAMGQLTISKDGTKLINALTCSDLFEIFDFNLATGVVSNPITIPSTGNAWGTAFSPDSKKVYVNSIFGDYVMQYDITNFNYSSIISSSVTLVATGKPGYNFGYMELGPDKKIYIPRPGTNLIATINNPNLVGSAAGFSLVGLSVGTLSVTHGISRIAYNITPVISTNNLSVTVTPSVICPGGAYNLIASGSLYYNWSTANTTNSIVVSPLTSTIISVTGSDACMASTTKFVTLTVEVCAMEKEISKENQLLQIFPTVFQNEITVKSLAESAVIDIYNCQGKQVHHSLTLEHADTVINLESCDVGVYYARVQINNEVTFHKLLKVFTR